MDRWPDDVVFKGNVMIQNSLRLLAAVCLAAAAGCGGGAPQQSDPEPAAGAARVDESKAAQITGRITYEGERPVNPAVRPASDPFCLRETPADTRLENVVVADDGGLENVFVYVTDRFNQYQFDVPAEPVKLDQVGCVYKPHVIGVRTGQPLQVTNSDDTLHNVNARAQNNRSFNVGQAVRGQKNTTTFTVRDVMIRFKCDVHPWMSAYAGVVEHPYFAVTSAGGQFELKNVPAGSYTIEAWHERLGTQTQTVTVGENETKAIDFTFKAETN
jgi:plastocyanin